MKYLILIVLTLFSINSFSQKRIHPQYDVYKLSDSLIQDLTKKTCDTWDMTARFLAVSLGNIVKNIEKIPKYGNSEIENAAKKVKEQIWRTKGEDI